MTQVKCEDCDFAHIVKEHQNKIEKINHNIEEIKIGLHGSFKEVGIKGRVDKMELVIESLKEGIENANQTAKKSLNILIAIAVTIVGAACAGLVTLIFNFSK
jgi:hypothetical protein